ncbi:MAG TPA: hypothetical protein VL043_04595 [Protaetiibacter sp.]|nr:hypothetical protein [Protaetiibacter sp.]
MTVVMQQQHVELTVTGTPLEVQTDRDGFLTMDRRWTPYIQGEFTVVAPADPSILDPREVPVLEVTWLQRFGPKLQFTLDLTEEWAGLLTSDLTLFYAGDLTSDISGTPGRWYMAPAEPTSLHAVLVVRERVNNFDGTYTIRVEGVDARFRDYPHALSHGDTADVSSLQTLRAVYGWLEERLRVGYPDASGIDFALEPGGDDVSLTGLGVSGIFMEAGMTLFDAVQTYLGNLRLWGSEEGKLILDAIPTVPPGQVTITDATLTGGSEVVSIDDAAWGDALLVEYEKKSTDPQVWNWVRYRTSVTDPIAKMLKITLPGYSPFSDMNAGYLPWPEGDQLYGPLLERARRRALSVPVTAVNNLAARPDVQATIIGLPGSPDLVGVITATTWRVSGEMQLTLEGIEEA